MRRWRAKKLYQFKYNNLTNAFRTAHNQLRENTLLMSYQKFRQTHRVEGC